MDALASGFKAVEIEINHDCNRACAYCPNSRMERKHQGRMSEELFLKVMTELRELRFEGRISYHFYNEPLLSPDLDRFVALTRGYLPKVLIELYTNGLLLTEDRLRTLLALGVNKFTVTRHHGLKEFPFADLYTRLEPEVRSKIKLQEHGDLYLSNRGGILRVGQKKLVPPLALPCFVPSILFVVTVNGDVLPCFEDYEEKNAMGNVREKSLVEIWNSERYVRFRDDLKARRRDAYPVCRDCNRAMVM